MDAGSVVERVWPPEDRREQYPGGWIVSGSCGRPHMLPRAGVWVCPECDGSPLLPEEGCPVCAEIDHLRSFNQDLPARRLARELGMSERTIYRHLHHRRRA